MYVVTTHRNTDFDGLASVVAATMIYPDTIAVLPKAVNPNVKGFVSIHKELFRLHSPDEIDFSQVERLIVVDVNTWRRLGRMSRLREKEDLDIYLWDHHGTRGDIVPVWDCRENMGANITLMIRKLKKQKKILTPIQATLFLAGIYEDTGNLTFNSTQAEDVYAAAWLLERKADLSVINSFLRPTYNQKQKDILFKMVKSAKREKVNGYTVSINRQDINGHVEGMAVLVRMYREILNVDAAFGLFTDKKKNRCMVIGRSNIDGLNIGSIMKSLGGGGHPGAGSAMLKSVNPDKIEEMIVSLICGNQQASVQISDLMSFPVFSVTSDTRMAEVAAILRKKGCTGVPIVNGDRLMGIISRRDFRKIKKESQLEAPVKAFMQTKVFTIEPGKSPMQAVRIMVKHDIGRLPVVEDDRIIGIITRSDAMLYFYDILPD